MTAVHIIESADRMREWGERLGALLAAGDVVILTGDLGAGKTTLTQGIARGLGVTDRVTSPTFVIAHEHRGRSVRLVHIDAYRLGGATEFDDLDLDVQGSVLVVEWGGPIADRIAEERLHIDITANADDERTLTCRGVGARWPREVWPC